MLLGGEYVSLAGVRSGTDGATVRAVRANAHAHHDRGSVRARGEAALARHHALLAQPSHSQWDAALQKDAHVSFDAFRGRTTGIKKSVHLSKDVVFVNRTKYWH